MNILVNGSQLVFDETGWHHRMGVGVRDTGNALDLNQVAVLSAAIHLDELKAYRQAVGRQTRQVVRSLSAENLQQKLDASRLEQVTIAGALGF